MMTGTVDSIKQLREMTCASIADCKAALDESGGDIKRASQILKERGLEIAAKKATRAANQGRIEGYVHIGNRIGVLVEVNSETDFVGRNEEFIRFSRDMAMQIAAADPKFLSRQDVPPSELEKLDDKQREEYFKEHCLLDQPFIKDEKKTIKEYLTAMVAKMGENISIRRFVRFRLGEAELSHD